MAAPGALKLPLYAAGTAVPGGPSPGNAGGPGKGLAPYRSSGRFPVSRFTSFLSPHTAIPRYWRLSSGTAAIFS